MARLLSVSTPDEPDDDVPADLVETPGSPGWVARWAPDGPVEPWRGDPFERQAAAYAAHRAAVREWAASEGMTAAEARDLIIAARKAAP